MSMAALLSACINFPASAAIFETGTGSILTGIRGPRLSARCKQEDRP
jgi:hypothetical protein